MTHVVVQTDHAPFLVPHTREAGRLAAGGISLVEGSWDTPDTLVANAGDADVLWVAWKPYVDAAILEALPRVRLVVRWGIGYEQIDTTAATRLGVAVANAPTYGTEDVAEHAITLLLALERRLVFHASDMQRGGWTPPEPGTIRRVSGRTLGLLGVGRIGAALARRAKALGLDVVGYDLVRSPEELAALGVEAVPLEVLAERSDYVSVHVPHTPQTEGIVNRAFLDRMAPTSFLINTSRGRVVDEADLTEALAEGRIAGAGLDVFVEEPLDPASPLRALPNVILTPHYAGYSEEAWTDLREEMCTTTIEFLGTGWASTIVNPEVRAVLRGT